MFEFFIDHELFPVCQSGFLPGASLISQLLKYTWNTKIIWWRSTYRCKGAFLDIFWHKGLVSKLKSYGMSNNLLKFIENYFTDCKQRLVSIDYTSS